MIRLNDVLLVQEIKFTKLHFSWTYYGFIRLNLIVIVTFLVEGLSDGDALMEIIKAMPYGFLIATSVSIFILPFVDLWEFINDKVVCSKLGWDYEADFLLKYTPKELDKLREQYKKCITDNVLSNDLESKVLEVIKKSSE